MQASDSMKQDTDNHQNALAACREVAREEHRASIRALQDLRANVRALDEKLEAILDPAEAGSNKWTQLGNQLKQRLSGGPAAGEAKEVKRDLRSLNASLQAIMHEEIEDTERSIRRKGKRLEMYTVTLFGRTITGKSTIREFITGGDGSTIGEGAQRTTQSINEYTWAGLRIVDTPGFGAYDGEEDTRMARMIVEESDLILFLTATIPAVQRPSFQEMDRLYDRDKPILFVLNVMHDLTNSELLLEEFLESPEEDVFSPEILEGYTDRIEDLATNHLGMARDEVRTCPIHAQAAFLSTQSEFAECAKALLEGSRIHDLLQRVSDDVIKHGTQRRLQTITGGTMHAATRLKERLANEHAVLKERTAYLQTKVNTLENRLDREKKEALNTRIPNEVSSLFRPLRQRISTFVDDNIQREDVGEKWQTEVEKLDVKAEVKRIQDDLESSLQDVLRSFGEEMAAEADMMDTQVEPNSPSRRDPINWKRGLGWTSAGSGALGAVAGIAAKASAANFWNPVGIGLGIVAVAAGVGSWFSTSKNEKLQKAKSEAAEQLRTSVDEMESTVCSNLKDQYEERLFPAYSDHAVETLRTLHASLRETQSLLGHEIQQTESIRSRLAERLRTDS